MPPLPPPKPLFEIAGFRVRESYYGQGATAFLIEGPQGVLAHTHPVLWARGPGDPRVRAMLQAARRLAAAHEMERLSRALLEETPSAGPAARALRELLEQLVP